MHATTDSTDSTHGDDCMTDSATVALVDRTAFERDMLYAIRSLEQDEPPKGLTIKDRLETEYGEEINHSRLYQNLNGLVEDDLLSKGQKDDRTNEYATTETGRKLLEARADHRAEQVGLSV